MAAFEGLGKALRWLRARQDRRQYQVAEAAGVTKAMLSAYETGKQNPSLDTLEKILDGLGATLGDLQQALLIVNQQLAPPEPLPKGRPQQLQALVGEELDRDLRDILKVEEPLPREEEEALRQMLQGFQRLLRYIHRQLASKASRGNG